jgi:hypothetical protein
VTAAAAPSLLVPAPRQINIQVFETNFQPETDTESDRDPGWALHSLSRKPGNHAMMTRTQRLGTCGLARPVPR